MYDGINPRLFCGFSLKKRMPVFSANGGDEVELRVPTHWPPIGAFSRVDLQQSAVVVPRAKRLTPVDFAVHAGIYSIGLTTCSSITYLMGPAGGAPVYTHGAMSHIPESLPGPFCSPAAALATVPGGGGVVVLDVVIYVNTKPAAQTILELQNFVTGHGIQAERIWVYDGQGDPGESFGVRRDGRAGMPFNYRARAAVPARKDKCTII